MRRRVDVTYTKGQVFRDLRKRLGLTQAEIGAKVDRNQDYWSRLETGRQSPTLEECERIARKLGISPRELTKRAFAPVQATGTR